MSFRKPADQMAHEQNRVNGWQVRTEYASDTSLEHFTNEKVARRVYKSKCEEVRRGDAVSAMLECDSSVIETFDETDV